MRLLNFRAFEDTGLVELPALTVIFGKNSSGKTTLLRAPLLLEQLMQGQTVGFDLPIAGPNVDFGSYRDLVYHGEMRRDVELQFDFSLGRQLERFLPRPSRLHPLFEKVSDGFRLVLTLHWNARSSRAQTEKIELRTLQDETLVSYERKGPHSVRTCAPPLDYATTHHDAPELALRSLGFGRYMLSRSGDNPTAEFLSMLSFVLSDHLQATLRNLLHLGPLRDMPERAYRLDQTGAIGGASFGAIAMLSSQRDLAKSASAALRQLGVEADIDVTRPAPGYAGIVLTDGSGRRTNLADVGFGISQVLPILVALTSARPESLVLIEQPELHLHPEHQGALADVLLRYTRERRLSLVVESHSEHILMRLQRRIASQEMDPSEVAVYIVDAGRVTPLEIDPKGRLDTSAFPSGFFEEEWTEAVELARAATSRK